MLLYLALQMIVPALPVYIVGTLHGTSFTAGIALGLGPALGLPLLNNYSFHILVSSIVFLVCIVFVLIVFIQFTPKQHTTNNPSTMKFRKVFMDRGLMFPCILNMLLSLTYGGIISFIAVFCKELHIMNPGYFFLCNALAVILVRPISGKLFDKKGHATVLFPGAILTIFALVLLSFSTTPILFLCSGLFYGLGFGMLQPSLQAWTIKRVTPENRGIANAMFINSIDFGIAVGSMLLGLVIDVTSNAKMYRISALFMVLFLILYGIALIKDRIQSSKRGASGNMDVQYND
jgi:predicted MFS family arabinose efflux permease